MLCRTGDEVDARRFDARVAEDVRKLDNVLVGAVKRRRKQVAQVVRKDLLRVHARALAEFFHLRPDLITGHCIAAFGAKDRAGSGFLPRGKFEQLAAEFGGQQNGADLAFERDLGLAVFGGLDGDVLYLADANTGGADGLHQERKAAVARSLRRGDQSLIFCARQFLPAVAEQSVLDLQEPRPAIRPAAEEEKAVQRSEESVDRRRRVISFMQFVLPETDRLRCDRRTAQKGGEVQKRAAVLFDRRRGALFIFKCFQILSNSLVGHIVFHNKNTPISRDRGIVAYCSTEKRETPLLTG